MSTGLIPLAAIGVGPFRANAGPELRHKKSMLVPTPATIPSCLHFQISSQ
jgi:hypothetical protein